MASKLEQQDKPGANPQGTQPQERDLYFYHPDHLGSTAYVTDTQGKLYQHLEYFPFGETWVEEHSNTQRTPYLFTAKELDEETGLYYFGARYYDPRTSVWQSPDPILSSYLPDQGQKTIILMPSLANDHGKPQLNMIGMGGSYNSFNLGMYSYGHQNPIIYLDPDGRNVVTKLIKQTYKRDGNIIEAVFDVGGDIVTVFAPSSTPMDRIEAAVALVSPVDFGDIKAIKKGLKNLNVKFGGRKGNIDTRAQNQATADTIRSRGGSADKGFGEKERHFKGEGPGNKGGRFSDGSARDKDGRPFEFQSADTKADGSLTRRESDAAKDISSRSDSPVVCVSKVQCGE